MVIPYPKSRRSIQKHVEPFCKLEYVYAQLIVLILRLINSQWPTEGPQPSLVIAPYWYVPFARTQPLIGRDAELSDIEKKLFRADYFSKVAITGLGGVGKTRVALEIAYRAKEKYPKCSVFWIVATSLASIQQSYVNIRQQMHIPGEESKEGNTQRLVQHHLSQGIVGQWLLIIDNADDSDMWFKDVDVNSGLRPLDYLPSSSDGSILVTTRNRKAASKFAGGNVVSLSELDAVTAENVLRTSLVNKEILHDHDVTLRLLEQLAFLPLAIIQAAAYINANDISLWDYLSLLDSTETDIIEVLSEDFEDEIRYRDLNNAVATTWLVSFENILRQDPTAADFLCFMSCIEPKNIPQYLLPPVLSKKQAVDAIGTLTAYAFVSKRSGSQSFDLHRLVHLSTRNWLRSSQSLADWTAKTAARLAKVFPYLSDDEQDVHQKYHGSRALLPHVQKLCSSDLFQSNVLNNQRLIATAADCLLSDASSTTFIQISRMISDGKDIIRDLRGGNHRETLQIMRIRTIIQALSLQGRWEEDHTWIMEAITILERVREKRRPVWLKLYMKITLMKLSVGEGCRKEPGDLFMEEIECEKELRGKDDPIILTAMRILGDYFCAHNRFDAAVKLQTEVLATRKKLLGEGHPASLTTLYSLASTMDEQGRCKEAGTLHEKALAMRRKTLGDDHPHTFLSMTSLAYIYIHEHEHEKASDLGREICKGILRRKGGKELAEWLPLLSALEEKKLETVVTKMRDK